MRRYILRGLETLHGTAILTGIYIVIMVQMTDHLQQIFLGMGMVFLGVAVCYWASRKTKRIWQYLCITILLLFLGFFTGGGDWKSIWLCSMIAVASGSFFTARANRRNCWLASPGYPWLLLFLGAYFTGIHFQNAFLKSYAIWTGGMYFILCNFYVNLRELEKFIRTHATLERLPVQRMGMINQGMMWMMSGITVAAMFASPYLQLDQLIYGLGKGLKYLLTMLLSMIPQGTSSQEFLQLEQESGDMMAMQEEETFWFLEVLYRILDILCWMFLLVMIGFVLFWIGKKLYQLYCRFYQEREDTDDRIEQISMNSSSEIRRKTEVPRKERLFWNFSPEARIRKYYKKHILNAYRHQVPRTETPAQLEEALDFSEKEKQILHEYYEKARYSGKGCTKEEMQTVFRGKFEKSGR